MQSWAFWRFLFRISWNLGQDDFLLQLPLCMALVCGLFVSGSSTLRSALGCRLQSGLPLGGEGVASAHQALPLPWKEGPVLAEEALCCGVGVGIRQRDLCRKQGGLASSSKQLPQSCTLFRSAQRKARQLPPPQQKGKSELRKREVEATRGVSLARWELRKICGKRGVIWRGKLQQWRETQLCTFIWRHKSSPSHFAVPGFPGQRMERVP